MMVPLDVSAMQMTDEHADALKRLVTFVGILMLTFAPGILLVGIMLPLD